MNFMPVHGSSNIESYGYDPTTQTLAIRFHSGREYHHSNVPPETFKALQASTSRGSYYEKMVKRMYVGARIK